MPAKVIFKQQHSSIISMAGSSKRQRTNNDWLMQRTGLLIVYAWVLLAVGFFGLTAWDTSYLDSSEQYVSILAIIGGPALLIVTKILETWNQEKGAELQDYESQAAHERAMDEIRVRHAADMERNPHCEPFIDSPSHGSRMSQVERELKDALTEIHSLQNEISELKESPKNRSRKSD